MSAPRSSLGERFRHATAADHAEIDRHPLLRPLVSPRLEHQEYAQALAALHALHAALEPEVRGGVSIGQASFSFAERLNALEHDLGMLGIRPFPDGGGLAACRAESLSEAVGMLYVLEGSRLGGRMIHGRLRQTLPDQPMSFFATATASSADHWGRFQDFLAQAEPALEMASATASAQKVFSRLKQHLNAALQLSAA